MYRTLKTPFHASHTTIQQLFDIRRLSGTIWNDCIELVVIIIDWGISGSHKPSCKKN